MTVTVLFFAHYQDVVGGREQRVALSDQATVGDLAEALVQQYSGLAGMLSYGRVAVNADHADSRTILHDNDEVALMPPMSGGAGKN